MGQKNTKIWLVARKETLSGSYTHEKMLTFIVIREMTFEIIM